MVDKPEMVTRPDLIDDRGGWQDVMVHCYASVENSDRYLCFQTLEGLYRTLDVHPVPYDKE